MQFQNELEINYTKLKGLKKLIAQDLQTAETFTSAFLVQLLQLSQTCEKDRDYFVCIGISSIFFFLPS